jgi:hypothetical protein
MPSRPYFWVLSLWRLGLWFELFMIRSLEFQLATNNVPNQHSIVQQFHGSLSLDAFFINIFGVI